MNRATLEGVYVPRRDISDWEINIGGTAYRRSNPGPVASAKIQLDSIGCLTAGTISLKRPGAIPRPFEQQVTISVESKTRGWIPICRACLPPANPDAPQEWTLNLQPGELRDMDGYWDGRLVGYMAVKRDPDDKRSEEDYQLDLARTQYTETNRTVVERILKANPTASIGVDWQGMVLLATPDSGSPVEVSKAHFYDWKPQAEVVLPYATESRWAGPRGWAKGEYLGLARPPCTPRKAVDAGEPTYNEGVYPTGPKLVNQKEVIIGWVKEVPVGDPVPDTIPYTVQDAPLNVEKPATRKVRASQYAHVSVYDLQGWFEKSACAGQDNTQIDEQAKLIKTLQGAYDLALEALGAGHPLVIQEAEKLADARNLLRLMRVDQSVESFYEPLTAKLSYGFVGQDLEPGVVTGVVMWISTLSWDAAAVGRPLPDSANNPDPQNPLATGIDGVELNHVVHPLASPHTLMVAECPLGQLTQSSNGLPWQPSSLKIPESYFRASMGATLAASVDARWEEEQNAQFNELVNAGTEPSVTGVAGSGLTHAFGAGAVITGDLPPGMTLENGLLLGTPDTPGTYTITVNGKTETLWIKPTPPSRSWDGRWYFHVAAWWAVIYQSAANPI